MNIFAVFPYNPPPIEEVEIGPIVYIILIGGVLALSVWFIIYKIIEWFKDRK